MTMTTIKLPCHHHARSLIAGVGFLIAGVRFLIAGCAVAFALLAAGVSPLQAQSVACMVNGEPITNFDIEQRTKLNFLTTRKQMPRQEVIDELINEKVKIKEAKKFGVDPSSSDIDQAYATMGSRMRLSADQLTKSLESQGVRPETLKARLKADMVWSSLVRGRYKESLQVGEKDVAAAAKEGGEDKPGGSVRIQDAADRADRATRCGTRCGRLAAQGSRIPARTRPDLRAGQRLFQVDAECHDPRNRHQDLGRPPGPAA